jgi:starvation-inducible DNA-binding protein
VKTPRREKDPPSFHGPAAGALAPVLADLIALSLACKQAHWNVEGPQFSPLHALFDSMATEYPAWYDDIAERIRALRTAADGRLGAVAKATAVEELPAGMLPGARAVSLMLDRVEALAARLRAVQERLGDVDPVSEDMVIGIRAGVEKQAWMLRVQAS